MSHYRVDSKKSTPKREFEYAVSAADVRQFCAQTVEFEVLCIIKLSGQFTRVYCEIPDMDQTLMLFDNKMIKSKIFSCSKKNGVSTCYRMR